MSETKVVHFAPSEQRVKLRDPICGYAAPEDELSTNRDEITCQECGDWIGVSVE